MTNKTIMTGSALILALLLQGCIVVDRSEREGMSQRGTTIGEELEDLEEAYEEGLISQREYDRLRARILDL